MTRSLYLLLTLPLLLAGCGELPAPAQYDHSMLREYFGKSPKEVEETFGKPTSVEEADSQSPPENATPEEREKFNQTTGKTIHTYPTPDGDLVFFFNLNDQVFKLTYSGRPVSPPIDAAKEQELSVRPVPPIPRGDEDPQVLHLRYTLTARHDGKLLVRVREPLLAKDPPLAIRFPGFISTDRAPWADSQGSLESEGLAQRVLDLSHEDLAAPLSIEVLVVHSRAPEEIVRVHLWLHRGDMAEPWLNFYQCRPATKTTRASKVALDRDAVLDSGETTMLCSYDFGGNTTGVQVPLTKDDKQWVVVEFGWKSSLDLTQ